MRISLTERQQLIQNAAREFLEVKCPLTYVRQMERDQVGHSSQLWREMADLGWMGLVFPEEYGGSGGQFEELVLLVEEMGKCLLPGPFIWTVLGGLAIAEAGTKQQKATLLEAICRGESIATLALYDSCGLVLDESSVTTLANPVAGGFVLSGVKGYVPDFESADWLVTTARTPAGVSLFIVDKDRNGVMGTPLATIALDRRSDVLLDGVEVARGQLLGRDGGGWKMVESIL